MKGKLLYLELGVGNASTTLKCLDQYCEEIITSKDVQHSVQAIKEGQEVDCIVAEIEHIGQEAFSLLISLRRNGLYIPVIFYLKNSDSINKRFFQRLGQIDFIESSNIDRLIDQIVLAFGENYGMVDPDYQFYNQEEDIQDLLVEFQKASIQ